MKEGAYNYFSVSRFLGKYMANIVKKQVSLIRAVADMKDARRQKDMADLRAGVSGDQIARRSAWVSPESAKKARIVFA